MLPRVVSHADWSVDPKKRWIARAWLEGDTYRLEPPKPVGDVRSLISRVVARKGETAVLGFDFPIGVPSAYAERAGIESFPVALLEFGTGRWKHFFDLATRRTEISIEQPFYPFRPGGTKHADLITALGVNGMSDLRRRCDHGYPGRNAACALFWTLGGNQVGRAAISGWRDLLAPALRSHEIDIAVWPFGGELTTLAATHECVITETYPADACVQLGLTAPGRGWSKRKQHDRRSKYEHLAAWSRSRAIVLDVHLDSALKDGFGTAPDGEDPFDAVVGLLAMLDVVQGRRRDGAPEEPRTRTVEGWILGQGQAATAVPRF